MRRAVLYFVAVCAAVWAIIELPHTLALGFEHGFELLRWSDGQLGDYLSFLAWSGIFTGLFAYPCAAALDVRKAAALAALGLLAWMSAFGLECLLLGGDGGFGPVLAMVMGSAWCVGMGATMACLLALAEVTGLHALIRGVAQFCLVAVSAGGVTLIFLPFLAPLLNRPLSALFVLGFAGAAWTYVGHLLGAQRPSLARTEFGQFTGEAGPEARTLCPHCGAPHTGPLGTVTCGRCGCIYEERIVSRPGEAET